MALRLGSSTPSKLYLGATEVTKAYLGASEVYSSGAAAWTPASLGADLALWLDADDASTITLNGSNVSQWDDKSGNTRHATQATAADQPTYTLSGLNGKPVLTFSSDTLTINTSGIPQPYNIFLLGRSNTNFVPFFLDGTTSANRVMMGHNPNATGDIGRAFIGSGSTFFLAPSGSSFAYNAPGILGGEYNGTNSQMFANGSTVANGNAGSTAIQSLLLGNRYVTASGGATFLNGYIGEFLVVSSTLSTADRQKLEGYLAHKWGLTANLPAGHPYKSTPPTV